MSFECIGLSAEKLRIELLEKDGIGCVSLQDRYLRVAFSSVEEKDLPDLIERIIAAVTEALVFKRALKSLKEAPVSEE